MLVLFLVVMAAVLLLRAGFGLFALLFKLAFGVFALLFGGLLAVSAIGFAFIVVGTVAIGVLMLVVMALAPLWIPLLVVGWLLWMVLRPGSGAVRTA